MQAFDTGPVAASEPKIETGEADDLLPDPRIIARLAMDQKPEGRPAPLYLRDADAALPREAPPVILDA